MSLHFITSQIVPWNVGIHLGDYTTSHPTMILGMLVCIYETTWYHIPKWSVKCQCKSLSLHNIASENVPLKCRYTSMRLHLVTFHNFFLKCRYLPKRLNDVTSQNGPMTGRYPSMTLHDINLQSFPLEYRYTSMSLHNITS